MSSEHLLKLGEWDRPASLPDSLATELSGWRFVLKNPVAPSFYSKPGTPWDIAPEGCLRVSERWNIAAEAAANAALFPTDQPVPEGHWALARFEASLWRVQSVVPGEGRATVRELLRARADRLVNGRRWTRSDLELLQLLQSGEAIAQDALIAGDEARERSLRSLTKLQLATGASGPNPELPDAARRLLDSGKGSAVWLDAEAGEVAATILDWHARKQARAAARAGRGADARERGEALKASVADAVRKVFPGIPKDAAAAAAARLAPSVGKLGRMPGLQPIVDAVAEIRLERWQQAVASEPEVADRLLAMQLRGDPGRARKRYRDQRAVERVEAELRDWRGDLAPVSTRRLG